jgi:hypothetical protein
LLGDFAERKSFKFIPDEDVPLGFRQFVERFLESGKELNAGKLIVRAWLRLNKERGLIALCFCRAFIPSALPVEREGGVALFSVPIDDAVSGDAIKPRRNLFDRFRYVIPRGELIEDILKNIFSIIVAGDAPPDKSQKLRPFRARRAVDCAVTQNGFCHKLFAAHVWCCSPTPG